MISNNEIEILNIKETKWIDILEQIKEKNINIDEFEKYLEKYLPHVLENFQDYVGYIWFDKIKINIFPKIFGSIENNESNYNKLLINIKYWYEYNEIKNKNMFFLNNHTFIQNFNNSDKLQILDWFLENYVKKIYQIFKKHFYYEYSEQEEYLPFLKGKINFNDYFKKISSGNWFQFKCLYSEYTYKNSFNKIIKKCLKIILQKFQKSNNHNIGLIQTLLSYLQDIKDENISQKDWDSINLNNFVEFKDILEMSKIILRNSYFNSYGDLIGFSFLLHMPTVFENFVIKQLKKANIQVEKTPKYIFFQDKKIIPDIVITKEKLKIVGECKYKQIKSEKDINRQDFYQLMAYAYFFNSKTPIFIFPLSEGEEFQSIDLPIGELKQNSIKILKIPFIFNVETGEPDNILKFIDEIKDIVKNIVV